jgi:hypothetical protein
MIHDRRGVETRAPGGDVPLIVHSGRRIQPLWPNTCPQRVLATEDRGESRAAGSSRQFCDSLKKHQHIEWLF